MSFEVIMSYWKEALQFYWKKNLKLFCLATLNNFQRSLLLVVKNFWWVYLFYFGVTLFQKLYSTLLLGYSDSAWWYLVLRSVSEGGYLVSLLYVYFFYVLAARASVEEKNYTYFSTYQRYIPGFFFVYLCLHILPLSFLFPTAFIGLFFFMDMKPRLKELAQALFNSGKFLVGFIPVVGMFSLVYFACSYVVSMIEVLCTRMFFLYWVQAGIIGTIFFGFIIPVLFTIISLLLSYVFISALAIYYLKVKHQHHKFFFEGPVKTNKG